jgi:hypothetical protein
MSRPLTDLSDAELRQALHDQAAHVIYSYNAVVAEMDRRSRDRQARASFILAAVGLVIALAAIVVTALKA